MHAFRLHCDGARAQCEDATAHDGAARANIDGAIVHSDGAHFHKVGAHFRSAWESLQTRFAVFSSTYKFELAHDSTERTQDHSRLRARKSFSEMIFRVAPFAISFSAASIFSPFTPAPKRGEPSSPMTR
jgi:hypothetical protein